MKKISMMAFAIALLPQGAWGQSYQRVVSFGDSLTDNGNLFANFGQPPSPPYNKRFTNGFTFAEYLAGGGNSMTGYGSKGPGSVNYAWGGARNDNGANSNGPIPSTIAQIALFKTVGGIYGASDVVTYWGGANNIFQSNIANPLTAQANVQADATASGIAAGAQAGTLAAQGARTILVMNLPDFGSLPSYSSKGAQGVAIGSFASLTYNAAQSQALQAAAAAAPGVNIIQVDAASVFSAVIANPSAFGFSNVTQPCFNAAAKTVCGATLAAQNQYLFWDDVHPTDAGHQLLSQVVNDLLYTPTRAADVAALGEIGLWSRRSTMLELADRARAAEPLKGDAIQYFVSVAAERRQRDSSFVTQSGIGGATVAGSQRYYDYTMGGLRFGGFKNLGNGWTGGFAISALTGDATSGRVTASPTSLSADLTANWRSGAMFVTGLLGAGVDRYSDYKRKTSVTAITLTGDTDGYAASAAVEGGYDFNFAGNVTLTPVVRLGYLYSNVASFTESGVIGVVNFGDRNVQGLTGAFELRAKARISDTFSVNVMAGYEEFLSRASGAVKGQLAGNTALPFSTSVAAPVGAGLVFGAGLETRMGAWTAGLNYRGSIGSKSQQAHKGELKLGYVW